MFWDTGKVCLFLGFCYCNLKKNITNISVSHTSNKTTVNQRKKCSTHSAGKLQIDDK